MSLIGKRATWMGLYASDRPRDVLGLTEAQEGTLSGIVAFTGKDQDGTAKTLPILFYDGTDTPTLTDYASTPIGTEIHASKLTKPTIFIHKAKSATAVVGDWYKIEGTQCT